MNLEDDPEAGPRAVEIIAYLGGEKMNEVQGILHLATMPGVRPGGFMDDMMVDSALFTAAVEKIVIAEREMKVRYPDEQLLAAFKRAAEEVAPEILASIPKTARGMH